MMRRFFPSRGGAGADPTALLLSYGEAVLQGAAYSGLRGWGMGEVGAWLSIDRATKKTVIFFDRCFYPR